MVISYPNALLITMKRYFATVLIITGATLFIFLLRKNLQHFNSFVSISNMRWQKVHVQVRKGRSDPFHDKLIFDEYLIKGQSRTFTVDDGNDIEYRHDIDPNDADGVHFTNWTFAGAGDSSVCNVNFP